MARRAWTARALPRNSRAMSREHFSELARASMPDNFNLVFPNPRWVSPVSVSALTKRYGETLAVDDIGFDVAPGATVGLLGGNGAG